MPKSNTDLTKELQYVNGKGYETSTPSEGINSFRLKLAGSRHIEHFSNYAIANHMANPSATSIYSPIKQFVGYTGIERNTFNGKNISSQTGGYSVTNPSGVTYHYALPVYTYDSYQYMLFDNSKIGLPGTKPYTKEIENKHPYAYTWLLTAITGPDFVDKNNDGLADEGDLGYWVNFNYGKWTDGYKYRSPHTGMDKDIMGTQQYTKGKKQIYYLDAIETRSHTALFVKEARHDSQAISQVLDEGFDALWSLKTLRLSNITLLENSSLKEVLTTNNISSLAELKARDSYTNPYFPSGIESDVLKGSDMLSEIYTNSIKTINFNTDYHLMNDAASIDKGVPNSIAGAYDSDGNFDLNAIHGKLSLTSISFNGKGRASGTIPPINFEYAKNPVYKQDARDMWNMYKSDFNANLNITNPNLARLPSRESAQHVDAWSLTKITNSLGTEIEVEYESDDYSDAVLYSGHPLFMESIRTTDKGNPNAPMIFNVRNHNNRVTSEIFNVGDQLELVVGYMQTTKILYPTPIYRQLAQPAQRYNVIVSQTNSQGNDIEIICPDLKKLLIMNTIIHT